MSSSHPDLLTALNRLDLPLPGSEGQGPRRAGDPGAAQRPGPDGQRPPRDPEGSGREPRRPDARAADIEIGESEVAFLEDFLTAAAPDVLARFRELRERDPEEARRKFRQTFPRMRFLYDLRTRDPQMFALRLQDIRFSREALEAARAIAALDVADTPDSDPARTQRLNELKRALGEIYRVRGEIGAQEVQRMHERADTFTRELNRRADSRDAVIETFAKSMIERERRRAERRSTEESTDPSPRGRPDSGND